MERDKLIVNCAMLEDICLVLEQTTQAALLAAEVHIKIKLENLSAICVLPGSGATSLVLLTSNAKSVRKEHSLRLLESPCYQAAYPAHQEHFPSCQVLQRANRVQLVGCRRTKDPRCVTS